MKAGKNVWGRCDYRGEVVEYCRNEDWPEGDGWFPHYNPRRVQGDTYEYYPGWTVWEQAANAAMAQAANDNFRRKN